MSELGPITRLRVAALRAAATHRAGHGATTDVLREAGEYLTEWLTAAPATVSREPITALVSDQGSGMAPKPTRKGHSKMWSITDSQDIQFPERTALDKKGFPVDGGVEFTTDDDQAQQFVDRQDNADGSTTLSAKAPGIVQLTWTAGDDTLGDTLNVTTGDAVTFSDITPSITDQS